MWISITLLMAALAAGLSALFWPSEVTAPLVSHFLAASFLGLPRPIVTGEKLSEILTALVEVESYKVSAV